MVSSLKGTPHCVTVDFLSHSLFHAQEHLALLPVRESDWAGEVAFEENHPSNFPTDLFTLTPDQPQFLLWTVVAKIILQTGRSIRTRLP